ncbi:MAG: hypothetical protein AA931_03290 [Peptococcaceae bacterium 1109]|nr:MAG: hypothetical protein AA931_03290 [Peptococcaceae bacterium 1109]
MKFKFRLEKVLRVRRLEEDQTRHRLLHRQQELREAEEHLQSLQVQRQDVVAFGHSQPDVQLRAAMYKYLERLDGRIDRQRQVVSDRQEKLTQAKAQWLAARQRREVLENLREKRYDEYRLEQQRAEQKSLDEMGSRVRA